MHRPGTVAHTRRVPSDRQNLIKIAPRLKSKGMTFVAKSTLVFDLRTKSLEPLAREAAAQVRKGIEQARGTPANSTIKRRGPGRIWNVTHHLARSIKLELTDDVWSITAPADRLLEGYLFRMLRKAVPVIDDARKLLRKLRGPASQRALKRLVKKTRRP